MTDSFDPIEYAGFLRRRWRFCALAVATAVLGAATVSWLLPKQYTATATLIIEPPAVSDPRTATAISPIYLESLKTYEQFASSDSLFAKACRKFGLLQGNGAPSIESFKRRVLEVTKLKDTKLLRISVTLPSPEQAHQLAEYLAGETVALNRSLALEADAALLEDTRATLKDAGAKREQARAEYNRMASDGKERVWDGELWSLGDLQARTRVELLSAQARAAELEARGEGTELAGERARVKELTAALAGVDRDLESTAAKLAERRARLNTADATLRTEEEAFQSWSRRAMDQAATSGSRTEQLRIVDPGIVPQRPSFPNPPLAAAVALLLSLMLSVAYLSLRFGFEQQRARRVRAELAAELTEIRAARGGNR